MRWRRMRHGFKRECERALGTSGVWLPDEEYASRCMDCRKPKVTSLPYCVRCGEARLASARDYEPKRMANQE